MSAAIAGAEVPAPRVRAGGEDVRREVRSPVASTAVEPSPELWATPSRDRDGAAGGERGGVGVGKRSAEERAPCGWKTACWDAGVTCGIGAVSPASRTVVGWSRGESTAQDGRLIWHASAELARGSRGGEACSGRRNGEESQGGGTGGGGSSADAVAERVPVLLAGTVRSSPLDGGDRNEMCESKAAVMGA